MLYIAKKCKFYNKPVLGYILVGHNPESEMYVRLKTKACEQLGIEYQGFHLDPTIPQSKLIQYV